MALSMEAASSRAEREASFSGVCGAANILRSTSTFGAGAAFFLAADFVAALLPGSSPLYMAFNRAAFCAPVGSFEPGVRRAGFTGAFFAAGFALAFPAGRSGDDIDVIAFLHDIISAQFEAPVGHLFTGLHVIFVTMPRADEIHPVLGKMQAH